MYVDWDELKGKDGIARYLKEADYDTDFDGIFRRTDEMISEKRKASH